MAETVTVYSPNYLKALHQAGRLLVDVAKMIAFTGEDDLHGNFVKTFPRQRVDSDIEVRTPAIGSRLGDSIDPMLLRKAGLDEEWELKARIKDYANEFQAVASLNNRGAVAVIGQSLCELCPELHEPPYLLSYGGVLALAGELSPGLE